MGEVLGRLRAEQLVGRLERMPVDERLGAGEQPTGVVECAALPRAEPGDRVAVDGQRVVDVLAGVRSLLAPAG